MLKVQQGVDKMTVAESTHYWTSRFAGTDPSSPNGNYNDAWTLSGSVSDGAVNGNAWRISGSGQTWTQTYGNYESLSLICAIGYNTIPDLNEVLMVIDNGTYRAEVQVAGNNSVKLVGTSTITSSDLDITMSDENSVPCILRLTLASDGTTRLYTKEIIEDDDGQIHYLETTGSASTSKIVQFGNTSGVVDWYAVYFTYYGAYSPDEMDMSDWTTNSLIQTGFSIIQTLKNSNRFYIKNFVEPAAIVYAYDLSFNTMANRIHPPAIHVFTQKIESPDFLTLGGSRTDQRYEAIIYVTTKGTDYKNAYRLGLSIMGEVFDELYTQTGLQSGVDSIISYNAVLDSKLDDDETVCVHILNITYMKKIRMFLREV